MKPERSPTPSTRPHWSQVASTIAQLHSQVLQLARLPEAPAFGTDHLATVRQICRLRRARAKLLGSAELFGEPAWDMLLELYAVALEQRKVSVSGICFASGAPFTTALRWLEKLHESGFVERQNDELDARRIWVRLSDCGLSRMRMYFEAMTPAT